MLSSQGFHTLLLSLPINNSEHWQIIQAFKNYSRTTGRIKMFFLDGNGMRFNYNADKNDLVPRNIRIIYFKDDIGLQWNIKSYSDEWYSGCSIEVKVNPKILSGTSDYLTAATYHDMEKVIMNFNLEARRISPLLKSFNEYKLNRIDYCINFYLPELLHGYTCTPEQIMNLIRRGSIPHFFSEWQEYDSTSHRMKSKPESFYLINKSVTVNCYSKYMELLKRSQERESQGLSPIPKMTLDLAFGIIRFELQCKYQKTYQLSKSTEKFGDLIHNKYESLFTPTACHDIIENYYFKIVGKGDWYDLRSAVVRIKSMNYNRQKEQRLISALKFVSQCRSLAKAKEQYQGDDLAAFKRTLKDLSNLGINPVTIPKEWGIKHIWNLLDAYCNAKSCERWLEDPYLLKLQ